MTIQKNPQGIPVRVNTPKGKLPVFPSENSTGLPTWIAILYGEFVGSGTAAFLRGLVYAGIAAAFQSGLSYFANYHPSGTTAGAEIIIGAAVLRWLEGLVLDKFLAGWGSSK